MRKLLLFLAALPLLATPPVVSNVQFLYGSHSSVSVQFDLSAGGNNDFRVRYIPTSQGSCDEANASATVQTFSLSGLDNNTTTGLQLPVSGLAPNTEYEFCPEVSNDSGSTWSSTGGSNPAGADFTTLPDPSIHPALPIHPVTFDTSYPDTSKGTCWSTGKPGYCSVTVTVDGTDCPDLWSDVSTAITHQSTGGTVIKIPAGSVCAYDGRNGLPTWFKVSPDAIAYNPSNVSDNTITLTGHGLSEGQGVVFGIQEMSSGGVYFPKPPNGLGGKYGYVFFVHVVDADHFQLYQNWQQETGSETSGSNQVVLDRLAGWASSPGISVGEEIVGSGIPDRATITAIDTVSKTLTLSTAATATANDVTFTFGGPLQDITAGTSGTSHFVPWPRQLPYWVIVRTSTPDSEFAPEGMRVNPSWASKMVTFEDTGANGLLDTYVYSSHIRFVGIKWTWTPTTEIAANPVSHEALIGIGDDASDIIFDRNWFYGPDGLDDRVYELIFLEGMNQAIINSYWNNLAYWHAGYTWPGHTGRQWLVSGTDNSSRGESPTGTAGSTTFTIPQMTVHYGAPQPASMNSDLGVSWTGTPDSSITKPEIAVYFDMDEALVVSAPQGLTVTAPGATISYTLTSGSGSCRQSDPMIPKDSLGREAAAPLGCAVLNSSGEITSLQYGIVDYGKDTEGCQCFIGGVGPGPYEISDNYIEGSGLIVHFDNTGHYRWRGDYLIRRNTFHVPMRYLDISGNSSALAAGIPGTGYWYGNRQPLEWKGGEREWIDGNIFSGTFSDVNHGTFVDVTAHSGDSYGITDMDITNNTFEHGPTAGGLAINVMDNNGSNPPFVTKRNRSYNNLSWDINGFIYSTSNCTDSFGVGCVGPGGGWSASGGPQEDVIYDHNTAYDFTNGMYGNLWGSGNGPQEGVKITNNILAYGHAVDGQNFFIKAAAALNSEACASAGISNESATNCAFIAGVGNPDLIFKDNVIVPSWTTNQYPEGGSQISVSSIQSDWPDYYAQNTITGGNGVLADYATIDWQAHSFARSWDVKGNYTGTVPNFRLLSQSLYNCCKTTDGLQEGANIDQLEAAQGKVTLVGANQITSDSANITYVAPDFGACYVDYGTDPTLVNSFTRVSDGGGVRVRNVSLTGLSSHTVYYGRIDCAVEQPMFKFATN